MKTGEAEQVSRLLFIARDELTTYAKIVELCGADTEHAELVDFVAQIDKFRANQGWDPFTYGGEEGEQNWHTHHLGVPIE